MSKFEYKAVPAPTRGTKAKTVKTTEDRFALSMTETLNDMASDGWEYVRAETLPCDERKGLTGTTTTYQNILIFKRFKQVAQPLALDARTSSRPLEIEPAPEDERPLAPADHVTPRRITSRPPDDYEAPPLGSARRND